MKHKHPLADAAKLRPEGPALDRRQQKRDEAAADAESVAPRERLTVQLPGDTIERLRNAVYWTPGMTITGFIERCINLGVDRLETDRGSTFPKREQALRTGRPPK